MARDSSVSRQTVLILAMTGVGLLLVGRWVYQRFFETEEERVRAVVEAMAEAIGDKDAGDVLEHFSENYQGQPDKKSIHGFMIRQFLQQERIDCGVGPIRVALSQEDTAATARFEAGVVGLTGGGARFYQVEMELRKEDGDWRMIDYSASQIGSSDEVSLE